MLILLILLILAVFLIRPEPWRSGVAITAVTPDSPAARAGLSIPPGAQPLSLPLIKRITLENGSTFTIRTPEDYYAALSFTPARNTTVILTLNTGVYSVMLPANETAYESIGLSIAPAPRSNLQFGLDLAGGTRVMLKLAQHVDEDTYQRVLDSLRQRLNAFGLQDVTIRPARDLDGQQYVIIEMAGLTSQQLVRIVQQQGKFEARINNITVFTSEENDITYVCKTAQCSGIDPRRGCQPTAEGWACSFYFSIRLSPQAAERQAALTRNLSIIPGPDGGYLNATLDLYLDGTLMDSLRIAAGLRGQPLTDIQITGSGTGRSQDEARKNALEQMRQLQVLLETGSLPVKLDVVKVDTISPRLGQAFLRNALYAGIAAFLAVTLVVILAYRRLKLALPVLFTILSELILLLGFAVLIQWSLDLAAFAGLIIALGTGVDTQIVILQEALRGRRERTRGMLEKIKNAFDIILGSYLTTVVTMIFLFSAGAGLLKGFALITIAGLTIGVFLTRPAFADMISLILQQEQQEKKRIIQKEKHSPARDDVRDEKHAKEDLKEEE